VPFSRSLTPPLRGLTRYSSSRALRASCSTPLLPMRLYVASSRPPGQRAVRALESKETKRKEIKERQIDRQTRPTTVKWASLSYLPPQTMFDLFAFHKRRLICLLLTRRASASCWCTYIHATHLRTIVCCWLCFSLLILKAGKSASR
jgi:hypothetical protein